MLLLDEPMAGVNPTPRRGDRRASAPRWSRRHHDLLIEHEMDADRAAVRPCRRDGGGTPADRRKLRRDGRRSTIGPGSLSGDRAGMSGLLHVSGIVARLQRRRGDPERRRSRVDAGEIVCVIGPNGAGKSTLLKTIAGLLRPTKGAIVLAALPLQRDCRRAKPRRPASASCRRSATSSPR